MDAGTKEDVESLEVDPRSQLWRVLMAWKQTENGLIKLVVHFVQS